MDDILNHCKKKDDEHVWDAARIIFSYRMHMWFVLKYHDIVEIYGYCVNLISIHSCQMATGKTE